MNDSRPPLHGLDESVALRSIVEGTATHTGDRFFQTLVESLARVLGTHGAWVTEYLPDVRRLRALAFWLGGEWIQDFEHAIDGTPCEDVVSGRRLVHIPDNVLALYPNDEPGFAAGAVSYLGVPLLDVDGSVLGHLAVLDRRPMPAEPRAEALIRIFASRATTELQRLRAEAEVREREEKLAGLVDSAMDAIVELDDALRVTRMNPAAAKLFGPSASGIDFRTFLSTESGARLATLAAGLGARAEDERSLWIPGTLAARQAGGGEFPAEATLARFDVHRRVFYTLILRNVNERLEAERRIRSLTVETEYLREELAALGGFESIIGGSVALRGVLQAVKQVAATDATVLVLGETGTGKELVARAIHAASGRRARPLVRVNCAAIPAALVESEFFGHERGAFTGATQRREGRFALAHGGTILLDEVAELPADLQAKLLRVLQEGEFEPVGSSQTRKVDVRVIAATNRDLAREVSQGRFRQDLYYRLNVVPIEVPPLRERGDDVVILASAFADRVGKRMARAVEPPSGDDVARLRAYSWPGNVRELQNVIERAVITSPDGRLDLSRFLQPGANQAPPIAADHPLRAIRTVRELEEIERSSILAALEATGGRVAGTDGAAERLGTKPSTLRSRMKALGIDRRGR
ncbi:MAG TPA: sigma 54-interacting transcriptional regulator [Candidatus Eisenbacteria bacterium]|nr:sigma 54-interacting transcriptional regulator [Candidatus Eisenbacteria bacterium]